MPASRQPARLEKRRHEDFLFEPVVVLADDRDLQFLARTEVGEDARLAHLRDFGQRTVARIEHLADN